MIKRSDSRNPGSVDKSGARKRKRPRQNKRRLWLEGLEQRQLLAVLTEPPTQPAPTGLQVFTENRNIGRVPSFLFNETEGVTQAGRNDLRSNADFVPLGTGPGKQQTVDVSGSLPITNFDGNSGGLSADIDTFSFELRAGDILDLATQGSAGGIRVRNAAGSMITASDGPILSRAPLQSLPLLEPAPITLLNANTSVVIPSDGMYYVTVAPQATDVSGNYKLGLRVYRPTSEKLPIGDTQILYLDFAGDLIDNNIFNQELIDANPGLPAGGVTFVRSLADSLPILGLELGDTVAENRIIDSVMSEMVRIYEDLAVTGGNGDIESPTAQPGDYGIRILNSRDHAGTVSFNDPRVSRLLIGGTGLDLGIPGVYGIAQSVDIGNFDLNELGVFALDAFAEEAIALRDDGRIAPGRSMVDFIGKFLGNVAAHEAGHIFGMIHTNNVNSIETISDAGGSPLSIAYLQSLGNDGIFGTRDDVNPVFRDDFYQPLEVPDLNGFAIHNVTKALAHSLSSGTVGGSISGRVFRDANRNGSGTGDAGLPGVTVFYDLNRDGVLTPGEPKSVSAADGTYSIMTPAGAFPVIAVTPDSFVPTTPTTGLSSGSGGPSFGFYQVNPDITGMVYVDVNGNGRRDAGEGPIPNAYIYVDLDGDKRPDLGEPSVNSKADGSFSMNLPPTGTYQLCLVAPPGFRQTEPDAGSGYTIVNGRLVAGNAFFGLAPSTDFGDAPASYGDASHGITAGLFLGVTAPDVEAASQPNATATGDDAAGIDDEDGVSLTAPLGRGTSASLTVNVTNTTSGTAFLQAFMDFNGDGDFGDAGEQFVVNRAVSPGLGVQAIPVTVNVPATAALGTTFARFRLSQTAGLGATGFTGTGEVEDYAFTILPSGEIATDDEFSVSRNSNANVLDVLANDFQTVDNPLTIINFNPVGAVGQIRISADGKAILYTPPNAFVGSDSFSYTVRDSFGNTSTADVAVTVQFQSADPIAIDDTFNVPQGSSNRALNVLENDIPSTVGGISVSSVTRGSAGGFLEVTGGGQSIRYTPPAGFNGTEQFTYTIQDGAGKISSATGTVHLLPGATLDDIVRFSIELLDADGIPLDTGLDDITPSVRVGDSFQVRVTVDDLRTGVSPEGVASAALDLLYSAGLVAVETAIPGLNGGFPFDISFGQLFGGLQTGDADTPGILDDVGAVQTSLLPQNQIPHAGPVELFTVSMQAVAPGVAQFVGDPSVDFVRDPADDPLIETTVIGSDVGLTPSQLGFGRVELLILPRSNNFTSAVEDSYPTGIDSNGNPIASGTPLPAVLRVLANDNLRVVGGQRVAITQRGLVTSPALGTANFNNNGTSEILNDDFIEYRANPGANGLERFSYFIVDDEGASSIAEVTIAVGNHNANAEVEMDFQLVRADGTPINPQTQTINVGDRIGVQVFLEDLASFPEYVFAGYLDVLYSTGLLVPATNVAPALCTASHNGRLATELDFSACIGVDYADNATSGSASRPGLINEFGSNYNRIDATTGPNPALLATIFFDAVAPGTASVVGSPADRLPESDTVIFGSDEPVDVAKIRYDLLQFQIVGSPLQNRSFPQDVDADGEATALDALIIVNRLGRTGAGENANLASDGFFTDVNGDFKVTALDALQVINYISRGRAAGESPQPAVPATQTVASVTTAMVPAGMVPANVRAANQSTDAAFTDFAASGVEQHAVDKIVSPDAGSGQSALAGLIIDGLDSNRDDDDEDALDLFADDVGSQWR
jgi:hypothetical protein